MSEENDQGNGAAPATTTEASAPDTPADPPAAEAVVEKGPEALLAEARQEAQKNKDLWVRTAADFDNFRKRSRKELDDARKASREDFLKELLPVFDNLERAVTSGQRASEVKPVIDGLSMVLKQFVDTLARGGIVKVPSKGYMFDPAIHEAIQHVESDEAPGTVITEVQPGYVNGDRLVRAAMVVVAKPVAKAAVDGSDGDDGGGEDTKDAGAET